MKKIFWTEEKIINEAKNFKSYKDFFKSKKIYIPAHKLGLLKEIQLFLPKNGQRTPFWNRDKILKAANNYKNYSDFKKTKAYSAAIRWDLLPEVHKILPTIKILNEKKHPFIKDKIILRAKKFKSYRDFNKSSFYQKAYKLGILDEIKTFLPPKGKKSFWTKKRILNVAKKSKSYSKFTQTKAYRPAIKIKMLEEIHKILFPNHIWSAERILKIAYSCKNFTEFRKLHPNVYNNAHQHGLIEKIKEKLPLTIKPLRFWNKKIHIYEEAKKYSSRDEFHDKCVSGYNKARFFGILDKVCSHMKIRGNGYNRSLYAIEFPDNTVYIGLSFDPDKRIKQHLKNSHNPVVQKKLKLFKKKFVFRKFDQWININRIGLEEKKLISKYKLNGWLILNKAKTGKCSSLGGYPIKWTKEKVFEAAKKYKCHKKFRLENSGAFNAAKRDGYYYELGIYKQEKLPNGHWDSKENCLREARKFKKRSELEKGNGSAYMGAKRNKWLNEFYPDGPWPLRKYKYKYNQPIKESL